MVYYCGIDLGNKETTIAIRNRQKQVIKELAIETTEQGIASVFTKYKKMICIVEAAPMAEWICREVEKYGHEITIVCARKAKVVLSARNLKKKTDKRDARALAELCQSGWYESVHRKSEEARDMRSFLTARKQLVECSLALSSSIRGIFRAHGIRLKGESDSPNFADKVRSAMEKLPDCAKQGVGELLKAFIFIA
jgi:transposase